MIKPEQLIRNLSDLGKAFNLASTPDIVDPEVKEPGRTTLAEAVERSFRYNPWFIPSFVRFSFRAWADALKEEKVDRWIRKYSAGIDETNTGHRIGIIMAGNIPMVGFHDLLCVLASGNHALIKLSSADNQLIPAVLDELCMIYPGFRSRFTMIEGPLKNFDGIIATGSNNTSRYFDYYFGKYPHIIRKNRNGVAVITGNETESDLRKLADDIFIYFGLGCRNVSKLFIPEGFRIEDILPYFSEYDFISDLHKYRNNYDYQKSILLINGVKHWDNGFLLIKPDAATMSPISVLHMETYKSLGSLNMQLKGIQDQIQCIISASDEVESAIAPGQSQFPELWDYSDGVDTMGFLSKLGKNNGKLL